MAFSHPLRNKDGDLALTYGSLTVQVDSQVGISHQGVSDAHDLVIANIVGKSNPMPAQPPRGLPLHSDTSSGSAAQPAQLASRPEWHATAPSSSAAQHA